MIDLWGRFFWVPLFPAFYALLMLAIGDLRGEHVAFAVFCAVLGFWSKRTRAFLIDIAPYIIVGLGYDLVRYVLKATVTPDRVITCGLRDLELALFSIHGQTPQQFLNAHSVPILDFFFAIPYAVFAYVALLYAAYLYFVDRPRMRHYLWSFAIANYISFAVWVLLPAAPPWYVSAHGCTVDPATAPSAAALLRVDHALGIHYFQTFYSRASQVFGALPSMHCAYPALGLLTAWRAASWRTRPIHILYTLVMFSASVYLNHHWVIDGILGWLIAIVAVWIVGRWLRRVPAGSASLIGPEAAESRGAISA